MNSVRKIPEFKIPQFPAFQKKQGIFLRIFSFLLGSVFWVFLLLFFAFVAYTEWFRYHFLSLLKKIKPKSYHMPFWFAGICVLFFFLFTILIILINTFIKIFKN